jgi:hypothetical protein
MNRIKSLELIYLRRHLTASPRMCGPRGGIARGKPRLISTRRCRARGKASSLCIVKSALKLDREEEEVRPKRFEGGGRPGRKISSSDRSVLACLRTGCCNGKRLLTRVSWKPKCDTAFILSLGVTWLISLYVKPAPCCQLYVLEKID